MYSLCSPCATPLSVAGFRALSLLFLTTRVREQEGDYQRCAHPGTGAGGETVTVVDIQILVGITLFYTPESTLVVITPFYTPERHHGGYIPFYTPERHPGGYLSLHT